MTKQNRFFLCRLVHIYIIIQNKQQTWHSFYHMTIIAYVDLSLAMLSTVCVLWILC